MKESYEVDDQILSMLTFSKPAKVRVVIDGKYVRLYVGPRDWQWDRDTGECVGSGTCTADLAECKPKGG